MNNYQQPPEGTFQPQAQYPYPPQFAVQQPQPPQAIPQQPVMQQMPYAQPTPMLYPQQPYASPVMVNNVNVQVNGKAGPGFLVRALYFIFIGWWLGGIWLNVGFFLCATIIGLPLGIIMLNMLPTILTLRSRSSGTNVNVSTVAVQPGPGGAPVMVNNVNVSVGGAQQHNFLVRVLYFCFIGWWAGYMWACIGYALCLLIVTMPLGLVMLNRLPAVLTLQKN